MDKKMLPMYIRIVIGNVANDALIVLSTIHNLVAVFLLFSILHISHRLPRSVRTLEDPTRSRRCAKLVKSLWLPFWQLICQLIVGFTI